MKLNLKSMILIPAMVSAVMFFNACGFNSTRSAPTTVDLPQTNPKWQSIGNCWIYAVASWAESIALRDTGVTLNISESYITYRYFEEQLQTNATEIETGGSWNLAKRLINTYGVMSEGDFIPSEADSTFSASQKQAVNALNLSLKEGALSKTRDAETIRAELDIAFGVKLDEVKDKIIKSSDLTIGKSAAGTPLSLKMVLSNWKRIGFDYDYSNAPENREELPKAAETLSESRQKTLKRVKLALNAHEPVVMSWFVDFNALNDKGEFSLDTLKKSGVGRQGWHLIVIEDYVVEGINPATGEKFSVGEGEATEEEKTLAANYGDITYLVIKNSWGGSERPDRASYERDGSRGYHKLLADYLFAWVEEVDELTREHVNINAIVGDFVVPNRF